jgi:putative hemolysin
MAHAPRTFTFLVTLDGQPAPDVLLSQPGTSTTAITNASGMAALTVDFEAPGEDWVMAAHPEARIGGVEVEPSDLELIGIELFRYEATDNLEYIFQNPGIDDWASSNTTMCNHCHQDQYLAWSQSPHKISASNPVLWDLYRGTASAQEADCIRLGGVWAEVDQPGGGQEEACRVGGGVIDGAVNGCADCHAPGIDGELGGRDLREASGFALESGVHCDVCHRIDQVNPDGAPGVAGRLALLRPIEPSPSLSLGAWAPLIFGPYPDVLNPRMGAVYRPIFHEAELCSGCHSLAQPTDNSRWPDQKLPVQTTYEEWLGSGFAPCQSCHMPPAPESPNSATNPEDTGRGDSGHSEGLWNVAQGWPRPPGSVRQHSWVGPRQSKLLELAAFLQLELVAEGDTVSAQVQLQNTGPGHALPTGEPFRQLVLTLEASCNTEPIWPISGFALPEEAGAVAVLDSWDGHSWEGAETGDSIRVVSRTGAFIDYLGYGPFGDGSFSVEQKGIFEELVLGEATVLSVEGSELSLSQPLPAGFRAYRTSNQAYAGLPGWFFARITADSSGKRMVPHHRAVDIVADNRLLPGQSWQGSWSYPACDGLIVTARLLHRNYPYSEATSHNWPITDTLMAETSRSLP